MRSATLFINLDVRLVPEGEVLLDGLIRHLRMHSIAPSSVCLEGCDHAQMTATLESLANDFRLEAQALYSDEDRQRGYMTGHDRDGVERHIPMMRCSIGVLELPEGLMIEDLNRISAAIAGIKAEAKRSAAGLGHARLDENVLSPH